MKIQITQVKDRIRIEVVYKKERRAATVRISDITESHGIYLRFSNAVAEVAKDTEWERELVEMVRAFAFKVRKVMV